MHAALHHQTAGVAGPIPASGGAVHIRELRPDDEALYPAFLACVSAEDRRLRFFSPAPLSKNQIHAFTHLDRETAVAFVAVGPDGGIDGVARLHVVSAGQGEFAVLVRSDLKGHGLGRRLMRRVLEAAPGLAVSGVMGFVLRENTGMLALARELGFTVRPNPGDPEIVQVGLDLGGVGPAAA